MENKEKQDPQETRKKPPLYNYSRYVGVGIQMALTAVVGFGIGFWLDGRVSMEFPLFTLLGSILGVGAAIYYVIKEFGSKK